MLYANTKDILATMQRLGHRSITSTQLYTQLIRGHQRDEYTFKAAIASEEAQTLIESGFEYVTDLKQEETIYKLFRKRKPWKPC